MRIIIALAIMFFLGDGPDASLEKKIDKMLKKSFQASGVLKTPLSPEGDYEERPDPGLLLYQLDHDEGKLGYMIVTAAKGRYDYFDYGVIYNLDLSIRAIEILVYRSEHGYEISNKKWLDQFTGNTGCGLVYGDQIDALSGATYSASSITADLHELCTLLHEMRASGSLK